VFVLRAHALLPLSQHAPAFFSAPTLAARAPWRPLCAATRWLRQMRCSAQ
jgi:hypothetical protein